jgi:predicted RNase H-like nuclease (RuvC/YqgF family)
MSFLDAFKRRKPEIEELTSLNNQMDVKTLDQALGKIEALTAQIQGLETELNQREARILALHSDLETCKEAFGITKSTSEAGVINWESSHISTLEKSLTEVKSERDGLQTQLAAASTRIAELEKDQRTVSAKAREFLAAQGGRALPVSGSGNPAPRTRAQLAEAMDQANRNGNQDELKRLYTELKKIK